MNGTVFFVFLAASGAAALTGIIFKPGPWYAGLRKPTWVPPNWAFPVVWSVLYVLIAWAAARVAPLPGSGAALALWALQIALNTLWTPIFFGAHRKGMGAVILGALWLTVAAMLVRFWQLDGWAGFLILPYLVWLGVAGALNAAIWWNNRGAGADGAES